MQTIHRAITLADALLLRANSATVLGAINWLWKQADMPNNHERVTA
jgi:hypothetical protein